MRLGLGLQHEIGRGMIAGPSGPLADFAWARDYAGGQYRSGGTTATNPATLGDSYTRLGSEYEIGAGGVLLPFNAGERLIVPGAGQWVRGAVTNLLPASCDLTGAGWSSAGSVGTASLLAESSPIPGRFWSRFEEATVSGNQRVLTTFTASPGLVVIRFIVRKYGRRYFNVRSGLAGGNANVVFDFDTASVAITPSGYEAEIAALGAGAFLLTVKVVTASSSSNSVFLGPSIGPHQSNPPSYVGETSNGFDLAYAGVSTSAASVPIIPTSGAAATIGATDERLASATIGSGDGLAIVVWNAQGAPSVIERALTASDGTASNFASLYRDGAGALSSVLTSGGAGTAQASGVSQSGAGKCAVGLLYRGGKVLTIGVNSGGTAGISGELTAAMPAQSRTDLGKHVTNADFANAPIRFAGYRAGTLSNADAIAAVQARWAA